MIERQPLLELSSTSLGMHRALQCFEGERCSFTISVTNIGCKTINLVSIAIKEKTALNPNQEESAAEVYEKSVYSDAINSCWIEEDAQETFFSPQTSSGISSYSKNGTLLPFNSRDALDPNESKTYKLGVYGKKHCTGVTVQFEYSSMAEDDPVFYTRDLVVPILITVGYPLSLRNIDYLAFSSHQEITINCPEDELKSTLSEQMVSDLAEPRLSSAVGPSFSSNYDSDYFLFTFDVSNEWIEPFKITFETYDGCINLTQTTNLLVPNQLRRLLYTQE